jgi:CDP-diacylglycerol--glycerol-3-phosphate 3-phosphatidyltransferase
MPSIYDLKPAFQNVLRPVARALAGAGVTANQVTVAAIVLSLLAGAAIALWPDQRWLLLLLPVVLLLRMALNAIDGMLAREHGMQSALGAMLNELGDVVADAGLYLPLALVPGFDPPLVVVVVLLGVIAEMTGVVAVQIGATRRYDGPLGKSDRAFAFSALAVLIGLSIPAGRWMTAALALMAALLVVTIVNRARAALRDVSAKGGTSR